jgi:hypothetical protein
MLRGLTLRKLLVAGAVAAVAAAIPLGVLAATGGFGGKLDYQRAKWTTDNVSISGSNWHTVRGLSITRCTLDQVTATLTGTLTGGPAWFRIVIDDVPEAPMRPTAVRFVPQGTESFSFTFVGNTGPFEANDTHRFDVQWLSATGGSVTLKQAMFNIQFELGTQGC